MYGGIQYVQELIAGEIVVLWWWSLKIGFLMDIVLPRLEILRTYACICALDRLLNMYTGNTKQ